MKINYTASCLGTVYGQVEVPDGASEGDQYDAVSHDIAKFNIIDLDWDVTELKEHDDASTSD